MERSSIHSIGIGNKNMSEFLEELDYFHIDFLIDVRSVPYSKHNRQFNKANLERAMSANGITYDWWGDVLGGMPKDESCYTNGQVDYEKLRLKDYFRKGIGRLITAHKRNARLALMCSEKDPQHCHRSTLIGEELAKHGICIMHIKRTKDLMKSIIVMAHQPAGKDAEEVRFETLVDKLVHIRFN